MKCIIYYTYVLVWNALLTSNIYVSKVIWYFSLSTNVGIQPYFVDIVNYALDNMQGNIVPRISSMIGGL